MTTVLIVDDDPAIRLLLYHYLAPEFLVLEAGNGETGIRQAQAYKPEIVLLNLDMPGIDGYETTRRLKTFPIDRRPIVFIVTSHTTAEEYAAALSAGADDYIAKPVDRFELLSRMRLHLRLRSSRCYGADVMPCGEDSFGHRERAAEQLADLQETTVLALAKLAETRDGDTGDHLTRIRDYSVLISRALHESINRPEVDEAFIRQLQRAGLLHDVGKVGIPDSILLKPGRLTDAEMCIMKQHTVIGWKVLNQAAAHSSQGAFLAAAAAIARSHHERWDGEGYPDGIAGEDIPLSARIVAVADVFDALTTERPYKAAWTADAARAEILREAGRHFDPSVVEAFDGAFPDIVRIQRRSTLRPSAICQARLEATLVGG